MLDKVKAFLIHYYGPDNSQQKWYILLTVLAILWLPRSTRRLAGILFIVACVSWFVARWVMEAYRQYTPGGV